MKLKEINQRQIKLVIEKDALNKRLSIIENELEVLKKRKKEHGIIKATK